MYRTFTAQDYKDYFGFPEGYHVDGFLCYGTWDKEKQIQILRETIEKLGKKFEYGVLPNFLSKMLEFRIDDKCYWFDVSYGGAMLSEYLHLACLFGSKKNILLGSCGGLSPEIDSLDLILPNYSFGNESSTRIYDRESKDNKHYSDEQLTKSLQNRLTPNHKTWIGPTTTCQAMMGETLEDVQNWSKEGFMGVEMEAATVFAVSRHFSVPAAAVLVVGDNLIKGEHVGSESYVNNKPRKEEIRQDQYMAALLELME